VIPSALSQQGENTELSQQGKNAGKTLSLKQLSLSSNPNFQQSAMRARRDLANSNELFLPRKSVLFYPLLLRD
jgi:hypothetical protein